MNALMAQLRAALDQAAESDTHMRIGSDHVHLLRAALAELDRLRDAKTETEHAHAWQTLGYREREESMRVLQTCGCGEAREKVAEVVS